MVGRCSCCSWTRGVHCGARSPTWTHCHTHLRAADADEMVKARKNERNLVWIPTLEDLPAHICGCAQHSGTADDNAEPQLSPRRLERARRRESESDTVELLLGQSNIGSLQGAAGGRLDKLMMAADEGSVDGLKLAG